MRLAAELQTKSHMYVWSGHTADVDIVSLGPVEDPVEDKQNLQTPESQDRDERDSDTDDGAVGGARDTDGSLIIKTKHIHFNYHMTIKRE